MKVETNKVYLGDALHVLRTFPDSCIDCVMTSPPYWNVRNYGDDVVSIFDETLKCEHDWVYSERWLHRGTTDSEINSDDKGILNDVKAKTFLCSKCKAWKGQLGLESDFNLFVKHLCDIFDQIKRVLKPIGTCWVNLGDTYGGSGGDRGKVGDTRTSSGIDTRPLSMSTKGNIENTKGYEKCLLNIPHRFAIEMTNRGWVHRNTIIWHKGSVMPESVKDRFTEDYEYLFFFTKNKKYYFKQQFEPITFSAIERSRYSFGGNRDGVDRVMIGQPEGKIEVNPSGRNKRCVWLINNKGTDLPHYAVYPEELPKTPILAGCPENGVVLDPFFGTGTTGIVALKQNKQFVGIEINPEYAKLAENRLKGWKSQTRLIEDGD